MTNEQFEALVAKLEAQAKCRPRAYQVKVFLLALMGDAYLGAMVLLTVAVLIALIAAVAVLKVLAVKLVIVVGIFLAMILKALWIKVDPPTGIEINPAQAPELFSMLEGLRKQANAPRFHHVLIDGSLNAGVVQSPRLGIFGWPRNYLLIGLPLMKSLSVEQFKAVLAHELGHLSKGHGKMSNRIYRQRLRWHSLLGVLDATKSRGSFLFKPFLTWFAPYFGAYSFPMARMNEYEADASAARLTSPKAAAEALTGINIVGSYLSESFWPDLYKTADDRPQPEIAPYVGMRRKLAADLDHEASQTRIERAMTRQTDCADTHPALNDRLSAIGEQPRLSLPAEGEAADRLLGASLRQITEKLDLRWKEQVLPSWENRYKEVQDGRRQLAELNSRLESGAELTEQQACERASLTATVGRDTDDSLAQFRSLHQRYPDSARVSFGLGTQLLHQDDASGCELIEQAMRLDDNLIMGGCEALRNFHWRNGRKDDAHAWHQRLVERSQLLEAAARERRQVSSREHFDLHGLSDQTIADLKDALKRISAIRKVYLVKRRPIYFPEIPCFVCGFSVTGPLRFHSKERARAAMGEIQKSVRFPGETLIVCVDGPNYRFGRRLRLMRGARVL